MRWQRPRARDFRVDSEQIFLMTHLHHQGFVNRRRGSLYGRPRCTMQPSVTKVIRLPSASHRAANPGDKITVAMSTRITLTGFGLGAFALFLFLAGIGNPPMPIFDESSYVMGARSLLSGTQDLNPEHPPLAKFLIAGGMKLFGDNPLGWRLAGAALGALTVVAIFLWTYLLLRDYALSLTAAGLTLFNNFLFVMSRVAMLDVFYFAFVMWGVLAFSAAVLLEMSVA